MQIKRLHNESVRSETVILKNVAFQYPDAVYLYPFTLTFIK